MSLFHIYKTSYKKGIQSYIKEGSISEVVRNLSGLFIDLNMDGYNLIKKTKPVMDKNNLQTKRGIQYGYIPYYAYFNYSIQPNHRNTSIISRV